MQYNITILDIKLDGNTKLIIARCSSNGHIDNVKFKVPRDSSSSDIKRLIKEQLKKDRNKSMIGNTFNLDI